MRTITGTLTPELNQIIKKQPAAKANAIPVTNFRQLMDYVARLAYLNFSTVHLRRHDRNESGKLV